MLLALAAANDATKPFVARYAPVILRRADEVRLCFATFRHLFQAGEHGRHTGSLPHSLRKGLADMVTDLSQSLPKIVEAARHEAPSTPAPEKPTAAAAAEAASESVTVTEAPMASEPAPPTSEAPSSTREAAPESSQSAPPLGAQLAEQLKAALASPDLERLLRDAATKLQELADRTATPLTVLEQLLPQLRAAGIVRSERGPAGGYQLNHPPEEITLGRVVRLIQGPLAPIACATRSDAESCPMELGCSLQATWSAVRDATIAILDSTTFADLAARASGRWTDPVPVSLAGERPVTAGA